MKVTLRIDGTGTSKTVTLDQVPTNGNYFTVAITVRRDERYWYLSDWVVTEAVPVAAPWWKRMYQRLTGRTP